MEITTPDGQTVDLPMMGDRHSKFVWTSGADVAKIWRRHGWTPPSEYRSDYLFAKNREGEVNC